MLLSTFQDEGVSLMMLSMACLLAVKDKPLNS